MNISQRFGLVMAIWGMIAFVGMIPLGLSLTAISAAGTVAIMGALLFILE